VISDWERQQLARIERDLTADRTFAAAISAQNIPRHRRWAGWAGWQRLYLRGFLALALIYPFLELSAAWRLTIVRASLVYLIVAAIIEAVAVGRTSVVRRGGRHLRQFLSG
jgi:uncharacterized membrane protein